MKLIIKKEVLLDNLYNVSKAISSKNLIPVLAGIKFELTKKGLYLSASDTDISIQCFIDKKDIVEIKKEGSIVVLGKYILEIIKKLPNTDIYIEAIDGNKMVINTLNSEFNLNGTSSLEFPNLYLEQTKEPIILNNGVFKKIISQTFFATSQNESRPIITGINIKIENNILEVLATDSYRLAKKELSLDNNLNNSINIVVPGRNLLELSKIIIDDEDSVEMHIFNNKILFKSGNILFQSRLLSGTFPTNSSVIPVNYSINFECDLNIFYDMVDRAALLSSDKDKNIVKLLLKNNELIILSNQPEIGKVEEKMELVSDKEIEISFSSKFMLDALRSFQTKTVDIFIIDEKSPIIIKSKDDNSLIQLILPIKTY